MKATAEQLDYAVEKAYKSLASFPEEQMSTNLPGKWAKKEILGHLCDSAVNNLQRFIRIQLEEQPFIIIPYDQNGWVKVQAYRHIPANDILNYWYTLNKHIIGVISNIPPDKLNYQCLISEKPSMSFLELAVDYLRHTEHHLKQIFSADQ